MKRLLLTVALIAMLPLTSFAAEEEIVGKRCCGSLLSLFDAVYAAI
jgi:hypothetical protein